VTLFYSLLSRFFARVLGCCLWKVHLALPGMPMDWTSKNGNSRRFMQLWLFTLATRHYCKRDAPTKLFVVLLDWSLYGSCPMPEGRQINGDVMLEPTDDVQLSP